MANSATGPSDSGSGSQDSRTELIAAKIEHAWGSSVVECGYGAPDEVAERLYDALWHPDRVLGRIRGPIPQAVATSELWAIAQEALEARVAMGPPPDRGEFVRTVSDTIVRGVPVAQAVLPGAREALVELSRRGVGVMAWSAGEPKHQHHKLAAIGIVDPVVAPSVEPLAERISVVPCLGGWFAWRAPEGARADVAEQRSEERVIGAPALDPAPVVLGVAGRGAVRAPNGLHGAAAR